MKNRYVFSALTRISDLAQAPFEVAPIPQEDWANGDYVVGEVTSKRPSDLVELPTGRMAQLMIGDWLVGAFGVRKATLEIVGDWQSVQADGQMSNVTNAGLFGRITSQSILLKPQPDLCYRGHVLREGNKVCMQDFVANPSSQLAYSCPTILIIGTSMSAGKTTAGRVIIHLLKEMGLRVVGAKLTGAGRYRDILSMHDAGADAIFDFVDVGLPSSIIPPEDFRHSLQQLLAMISAQSPDVVVAEAGASPFEPYNGAVVLEEIAEQITFTVLCASDPYAVIGVSQSFGLTPDIVSGITTNTTAGIELVEKLAKVPALSLTTDDSVNKLRALLKNLL